MGEFHKRDFSAIFPIYNLRPNKTYLSHADIAKDDIVDFGNGFFISADGLIATIGHVVESQNGSRNYASIDGLLFEIEVLKVRITDKDENHVDAAIGKINRQNCSFYNNSDFESVARNSKLIVCGFSRKLTVVGNKDHFKFSDGYGCNFFIFSATCTNTDDVQIGRNEDFIIRKNFFKVNHVVLYGCLCGLSGSPVINELGNVIGIFKGGHPLDGNRNNIGNVLKIGVIGDLDVDLRKNVLEMD